MRPTMAPRPPHPLLPAALLALALLLLGGGCEDDPRERRCRLAVRSLVACPESRVDGELAKVLAYSRYALPDIEQEFHVSPRLGRLRLLRALAKMGDAEALPFARHVARWDEEPEVRKRAEQLAEALGGSASEPPPGSRSKSRSDRGSGP